MKEKKKIRVGMIGYKFMGKAHSHAYRDIPFYMGLEAEPVLQAIAGRDENAVKEAALKMGWASWETDWRKLIEREDIDLVDIGTPNNVHAEMAIAALEAGKHVVCEKPLAMNAKEAFKMYKAAVKSGKVHMISHNYRYVPAVQMAKQMIEKGLIGTIRHFRGVYLQDWITDPNFPLIWRLRKEVCGSGALGDLLAHSLDLARFLVGEISKVSATMSTFIPQRPIGDMTGGLNAKVSGDIMGEVDVDDAVACLAQFENGAMGVFEASRFALGNRNGNRFEINGSKGSIRWDMENMNNLQVFLESDSAGLQGFRTINCTEEAHPFARAYWPAGHIIGYEHTFINLLSELIRGIEAGECPTPNFEDGMANQVVLDCIADSASSGKWVAVPKKEEWEALFV
ncbi:Gfo/Idh/MocA family protein [Paenibacillus thermotolerans]|uniref:Gfo/Idh/MocA family protein n=1 Tax=Paenibacillus thermotolerans TaxID=3027807 RepID=UPI002367A731|nr:MULTISPECIES: Gfo/Idh/MocA family oxidoreductase [unclassified Paenibacillus]